MRHSFFLPTLFTLISTSLAIEFSAPTHTETPVPNETGVSPKPTPATTLEHAEFRPKKRQVGYVTSSLNPEYGYCGFFGGRDTFGYASGTASCVESCVFWSTAGSVRQGCCDYYSSCTFATTCYDYSAVYYSSKCDYNCYQNNGNQICDNTYQPFCQTYSCKFFLVKIIVEHKLTLKQMKTELLATDAAQAQSALPSWSPLRML